MGEFLDAARGISDGTETRFGLLGGPGARAGEPPAIGSEAVVAAFGNPNAFLARCFEDEEE